MSSDLLTTQSFPVFRALGEPRKSLIEKFLSIFADVRAGEGATVLLLILNGFLLMASYYLLKVTRDAILLSRHDAQVKSYSAAAQAALLLIAVPLYGKFASRVNRNQLLTWVTLFFASHAAIFYVLGPHHDIGIAFYIWVGVLNMLLVAQFWGFANDVYKEAQGKRLFPVIGAGTAIGSAMGAYTASQLYDRKILDAYQILVVGALALAATVPLTRLVHARESRRNLEQKRSAAVEPLGREGGFQLVCHDRYLLLIAVMVLLLNLVNTTGGYLLDIFIKNEAVRVCGAGDNALAARTAFIGGFSGTILTWANLLVVVIQMFVVSRVFLYLGVRGALFVLPALALGSYGLIAAAPVLSLVRTVKIAENATDYSLSNTARAALFLPTSREAKYKAKVAIDSFFARFGDMIHAAVVFVGLRLALTPAGFATVNVAFVCVWLVVVVLIAREHKRRSEPTALAATA